MSSDVSADDVESGASSAASDAWAVAKDAFNGVEEEGAEFLSKAEGIAAKAAAKGKSVVAWGEGASKLILTKKEVVKAVEELGIEASGFTFDFVKFDIFRDFFQILGLFFIGIRWPNSFKRFFGYLFRIFSLTLPDLFTVNPKLSRQIWFWLLFILGVAMQSVVVSGRVDPDDIREGLEARHWVEVSAGKRFAVKVVLTILTTLYMPVSEVALRVLVCDDKWKPIFGGSCYTSVSHFVYIAASLVMTALITFWLPVLIYRLILTNKPMERTYNDTGRELDDKLKRVAYQQDLRRDVAPYVFLYYGYEFRWAHFKVIVMAIKYALILPIILLSRQNAIYSGKSQKLEIILLSIVVFVVAIYSAVGYFLTPFLLRENDLIDRAARTTAFLTALIGLFIACSLGTSSKWGIVLNVLHVVNIVTMLLLFFTGYEIFGRLCRRLTRRVKLTKSRDSRGAAVFAASLSLPYERQSRIWRPFWDAVFTTHPLYAPPKEQKWQFAQISTARNRVALSPAARARDAAAAAAAAAAADADPTAHSATTQQHPQPQPQQQQNHFLSRMLGGTAATTARRVAVDTAPYLKGFTGTIGERHQENKRIAEVLGVIEYERACREALDPDAQSVRYEILKHLVGLDVYFDGEPEDGHLDSMTCFGRLYALPFPLTGVMVYDDSHDHVFLRSASQLRVLMAQNSLPEVMRRRYLRTRLRALDGRKVAFYHKVMKEKWLRDESGKEAKEWIPFEFNVGVLRVHGEQRRNTYLTKDTELPINMSEGFAFSIVYNDGVGRAAQGTRKTFTHEPFVLDDSYFAHNVHGEFLETDEIVRLLEHPNNAAVWKARHAATLSALQEYRDHWRAVFRRKEEALSFPFHYHVYNNAYMSRNALEVYLSRYETGKTMQTFPVRHAADLDALYARLKFFDTSPGNAYWFVFFHDMWTNNSEQPNFASNPDRLNPASPTSLCYTPMRQSKLVPILKDIGIYWFIGSTILTRFYTRFSRICGNKDDAARAPSNGFQRSFLNATLDGESPDWSAANEELSAAPGKGGSASTTAASGSASHAGDAADSEASSDAGNSDSEFEYVYETDEEA